MNIMILGAAGFIGKNLTIKYAENKDVNITAVDKNKLYFNEIQELQLKNVKFIESPLDVGMDFGILRGQ